MTAVLAALAWLGPAHAASYVFRTIDAEFADDTFAYDVNNSGTVSGYIFPGPFSRGGFVDTGGTFTRIFDPAGPATYAYGINDRGTVVGFSTDVTGLPPVRTGFTYQGGVFTPLAIPTNATPFGINNAGAIVGAFGGSGFLYDGGTFTTFSVPGAVTTSASSLNDAGIIVGDYSDGTASHGFVYDHGVFHTIDVPGAVNTVARGINDAGIIVGFSNDNSPGTGFPSVDEHGFIYDGGAFTPFDVPGAADTQLLGINDEGWLTGAWFGRRPTRPPGNGYNGFLATPDVPEPGTLLLFAGALMLLWPIFARAPRRVIRSVRMR